MNIVWWANIAATAYAIVLGLICVYGLHRLYLVLTYFRMRRRSVRPAGRFAALPPVTVQLPMFNEQAVAQRVIEHAARIDYPADKLQIQVLDDSTDAASAEIAHRTVARLAAGGTNIQYIHRTDRTGYKAGALEAALPAASGDLIAIFDADFLPPANILRDTVDYFTDGAVGMVQTRWDHLNRDRSILTSAQAILLDGHFLIEHTARNRSGRFMSFNGTAGVWRKQAIADAGGWQHDTLTEDLDLSYRAQLRGWRFVFLPELTSPAELPPEMNAFKAQQHRWTKGGMQTCLKLLPDVLRSPLAWWIKLEAFFHLSSGFVYILMVLLSLLIGPALYAKLIIRDESPWQLVIDGLLFSVGTGSALAFYVVSQRSLGRGWWTIVRQVPALLALGIGIAFNNALAALEGLFFKAGEFVRTPKFGDGMPVSAAPVASAAAVRPTPIGSRRWRLTRRLQAVAELALAGYLVVCVGLMVGQPEWVERVSAAFPFVAMFIVGYTYVAWRTLSPARRTA